MEMENYYFHCKKMIYIADIKPVHVMPTIKHKPYDK